MCLPCMNSCKSDAKFQKGRLVLELQGKLTPDALQFRSPKEGTT